METSEVMQMTKICWHLMLPPPSTSDFSDKVGLNLGVAAIAPWFRLRLPSCGPGFESQAHHQFVLLKLYQENNENKQKEAGIGPFFKKSRFKPRLWPSNFLLSLDDCMLETCMLKAEARAFVKSARVDPLLFL